MSILHKYTIRQSKVQQLRLWVPMLIIADYEKVSVSQHRDRKINTYN